ncbi:hypothetical protein, partial [Pseudomonas sp. 43(2021)]|uniref:hypothetical protein n=1 Tax=Pseudomonas sp. 43(2021) TaxID=2813560 RepID=UPI001A9CDF5A
INTMYNSRVEEMMESTGMDFKNAIDTRQIRADWNSNQARAQLQYSKPSMYVGRISRIVFNNGNADLFIGAGPASNVVATLSAYQAWPWVEHKGRWSIGGVIPNLQFAAKLNVGDKLYLHCRRVEFLGAIYLVNCLAFPNSIVR